VFYNARIGRWLAAKPMIDEDDARRLGNNGSRVEEEA
jgi:hypothetical protein